MAWRDWFGGERRSVPQSADNFWEALAGQSGVVFNGLGESAAGTVVTTDTAMMVPAVASAVNFLSGTLAGLPLHVYRRVNEGRERASGALATLLHDAPNPYVSSFEWRKSLFMAKFTGGRGLSYIERSQSGAVVNIWGLDPSKVTVKRDGFVNRYEYRQDGRTVTYSADEIIDLPFLLKQDGFSHRGPIAMGRDAIGLALAVTNYASRFLNNGGVPPFAVTGNFVSPQALQRAGDDLRDAVKKAARESRQALTLPTGLDIKPIGIDPEKSQMVETQRFCIEQIARLYNIPPTFLQDLTHGTYSNTEQQDLHFIKHTLKQHVEQFEQELNLKLFGRSSRVRYVEMNVDGLLRGDFKTRMEGWARGIQSGLVMPSEARAAENWPMVEGSNKLFMQGGTVPLGQDTGQAND